MLDEPHTGKENRQNNSKRQKDKMKEEGRGSVRK